VGSVARSAIRRSRSRRRPCVSRAADLDAVEHGRATFRSTSVTRCWLPGGPRPEWDRVARIGAVVGRRRGGDHCARRQRRAMARGHSGTRCLLPVGAPSDLAPKS
jgi:hypothetical protein